MTCRCLVILRQPACEDTRRAFLYERQDVASTNGVVEVPAERHAEVLVDGLAASDEGRRGIMCLPRGSLHGIDVYARGRNRAEVPPEEVGATHDWSPRPPERSGLIQNRSHRFVSELGP